MTILVLPDRDVDIDLQKVDATIGVLESRIGASRL